MDSEKTLYIVIPAYNETENLDHVINDWYPVILQHQANGNSRLVIINDGSTDNTYDVLLKYAKTYPLLVSLTKENGGHGSAVLYGYNYAIEEKADYIFQTDSDGQTNPKEFEQFWQELENYDALIGSRSSRGDGASRKFAEKVLLMLLHMIFGVKMPDANAPYRLMKRELLEKYISRMPEDYFLPNVMLTTYFVYFKEKIKFIDISFRPRQGGTNSINFKKIINVGWQSLRDFRNFRKHIND